VAAEEAAEAREAKEVQAVIMVDVDVLGDFVGVLYNIVTAMVVQAAQAVMAVQAEGEMDIITTIVISGG
tara:strand:+ start:298 stop:504 length:207 start_codon:yes stop_codon:yes gene_type:complete